MIEKDKSIFDIGYKRVQDYMQNNKLVVDMGKKHSTPTNSIEAIIKGKIKKLTQKVLELQYEQQY